MRSLGVRLALAFAAVIAVSVGGVGFLVGRETTNEFQLYVERVRGLYLERVAAGLVRYYRTRGDWAGVEALLAGWLRGPLDRLAVADASGMVVADTAGQGVGEAAASIWSEPGTPLVVDGQQVGTLYATVAWPPLWRVRALRVEGADAAERVGPPATDAGGRDAADDPSSAARGRSPEDQGPSGKRRAAQEVAGVAPALAEPLRPATRAVSRVAPSPAAPGAPFPAAVTALSSAEAGFLERVYRAILLSALAAAVLAGLLSLLFARYLAQPLRELARGARRIAAGDLSQRVPVRRQDEIGDLAAAFNEMAASLARAETARRNLVADVAHELRTPLAVIEGTVDAMLDGVYPADRERLASLREEVVLLTKLVSDLRELSLAEAGGLRLEVEPVEPAALVRRAIAAAAPRAAERNVALVAEVAEELPLVLGDTVRITQVFANLLDNALRYTPPGGRVVVGAAAAPLAGAPPRSVGPAHTEGALARSSEERDAAQGVRFWVADTGPGIAPEDLPYVFDRFYRADPSRSRRSGGSGLGLAIARGYVEAQGGRIWAERADGQGAVLAFWLPAARNASGI
ncbi:MAG TPA: ATP-binding protein [Chloroflexota bacterium]|nr:ATP-binding protein [Chloroflexota bacterium]